MAINFQPKTHPREVERATKGPIKVHDQLPTGSWYQRANRYLAVKITQGVGTMTCAYAFAILAFISLPEVVMHGSVKDLVAWIAQTFLQLVLLSIILVGQQVQGARVEARDSETHDMVMTSHSELHKSHAEHSAKLDELIRAIPGASPPSVSIDERAEHGQPGPE